MLVDVRLEGGVEYGVGVAVVHNHDVLFNTARLDEESSTIIGVQLGDGLVDYIEFICRGTIINGYAFVGPIL